MHEYDRCNDKINKTPKRHPKPLQRTPNYHPSVHPPKCQKYTHPQRLICSRGTDCMLPIGQRACSGRIHNVIMLPKRSHILISNKPLLMIGKETKTTVPDDIKISLWSDKPSFKLLFNILEADFRSQEASWIWVPRLSIIIQFLSNIVDHILGWRWEDVLPKKVAATTTHRYLGTSCAIC